MESKLFGPAAGAAISAFNSDLNMLGSRHARASHQRDRLIYNVQNQEADRTDFVAVPQELMVRDIT